MAKEHVVSIVVLTIALALLIPTHLVYGESDIRSAPVAGAPETEEPSITKAKTVSGYPIISRLETKMGTIVIMSGTDGPLYNVEDKGGAVISSELSEKELQARYPEIYRNIKEGFARKGNWAGM